MTKGHKATRSTELARKSLPFKVQPREHVIEVGDTTTGVLEIPIYGGLTNIEAVELQRLIRDKTFKELRDKYTDKTQEELEEMVKAELETSDLAAFMLNYTSELALLIVNSRLEMEYTLKDVQRLPQALVNGLAGVMQNEITAAGIDRKQSVEEKGELPNVQ